MLASQEILIICRSKRICLIEEIERLNESLDEKIDY